MKDRLIGLNRTEPRQMPVEIFEFRIQIFGAKSVVGIPTTQPPCFAFMETTYQSLPCFEKGEVVSLFGNKQKAFQLLEHLTQYTKHKTLKEQGLAEFLSSSSL